MRHRQKINVTISYISTYLVRVKEVPVLFFSLAETRSLDWSSTVIVHVLVGTEGEETVGVGVVTGDRPSVRVGALTSR